MLSACNRLMYGHDGDPEGTSVNGDPPEHKVGEGSPSTARTMNAAICSRVTSANGQYRNGFIAQPPVIRGMLL
jgi:hypothetical protein